MSQQIYSFEYRKPRHSNPTFISNNVSSTLSFYNPNQIAQYNINSKPQLHSNRYSSVEMKSHLKDSKSDFSLPKISNTGQREIIQIQENDSKRQNHNHLDQYGQKIVGSANQATNPIPEPQNSYKRSISIGQLYKNNTKLLPSSIKNSLTNLNEKDIFMKQGHNYNIITYQPKQHNEHIKKYPKLSLEQKDQYYRLKYIHDPKFDTNSHNYMNHINPQNYAYDGPSNNHSEKSKHTSGEKMAGLHTYKIEGNRRNPTPISKINDGNKILANGLDAPNTKIPHSKTKFNPRSSKFDMKLLSNMDQFNYYA